MLIKEPLLREKRIKWPLTRSVMRCTHLLSGRLLSLHQWDSPGRLVVNTKRPLWSVNAST